MINDTAVDAVRHVLYDNYYAGTLTNNDIRAVLEAAAPHMLAEAWDEAYRQGVDDERTSASNAGIAGCFCNSFPCKCVIEPARTNPYRSQS